MADQKVKYDLVEGVLTSDEIVDVVLDIAKDPRFEGFDGLDAFDDTAVQ